MGLRSDLKTIKKKDPAAGSSLSIILTYNGMHAVWAYRVANVLWKMKLKIFAKMLSSFARVFTGVEIHPAAAIGKNFFIDHGQGVVIGETSVIGNNVLMYHQVTLGGTGNQKEGRRHPSVCDNVMFAAGAKVLGHIHIGTNSRIGANTVVLKDVPANATAVGMPARYIFNGDVTEENCSLIKRERK
jgi:serine O-acetyltransferase